MNAKTRMTLHDVARVAGVSHNTVSLVVHHDARVSPKTRARVQAAIDRLGYHPNAAAATLRSTRSGTIGLLAHHRSHGELRSELDVFRNRVWQAVWDAAQDHDFYVLQANLSNENRRRDLLSSGRIDGLLVEAQVTDEVLAEIAATSSLPIVVVGRGTDLPGIGWVKADEEGGAYMAANHLLASGRKTIGLLTERHVRHPAVREREAGVRRALLEAGDRRPARRWFGDWTFESGLTVGHKLGADRNRPGALFAVGELMAAGCIQALLETGVRVPEDVAVVAVEDSRFVEYSRPQISAVHVPMYQVAYRATEEVLTAVATGVAPASHILGTKFISRDSSA